MLAIKPISMANHYSFRANNIDDNYAYSKEQYETDKTKLEEHLEELNDVIENTQVPKPVRVIGKVVSVGIGAALGFVSMKFGAQGVAKLVKKGVSYVKELAQKPAMQKAMHKAELYGRYCRIKIGQAFKNSTLTQKIVKAFENIAGKYNKTKFAKFVNDCGKKINKTKTYGCLKDVAQKGVNKVKNISKEQVEKGVTNLFAVSGGVTGGITALQEVAKGNE